MSRDARRETRDAKEEVKIWHEQSTPLCTALNLFIFKGLSKYCLSAASLRSAFKNKQVKDQR